MQVTKLIAFCFEHYEDIEKAIYEKRRDPNTPKSGGGNGHCRINDPTAMLGIRNVSELDCVAIEYGPFIGGKRDIIYLRHPERWLKVIDYTSRYYSGKIQGQVIELRFKKGLLRDDIVSRLNIGRTLYHVLCNDIFCFATGVAMGLGLESPKH